MTTNCCVGPGGAQDGVAVGGRARVVGRRRPPRRPAARLRLDVALPVLRETPCRQRRAPTPRSDQPRGDPPTTHDDELRRRLVQLLTDHGRRRRPYFAAAAAALV